VTVFTKAELTAQAGKHAGALEPLLSWHAVASRAEWHGLHQIRRDFPSADQIGNVLVFNVKGNKYRLIVRVDYTKQELYVKALLTHAEYDKRGWMKWA
jgi:mRNA interferase HigB